MSNVPSTSQTSMPLLHSSGMRSNNDGLMPPQLQIPKRRSLNELKAERSPASRSESPAPAKKGGKGKRFSSGPKGWFRRNNEAGSSSDRSDEELDLESAGVGSRQIPKPVEPVSSPLSSKKTLFASLGLAKRRRSNDSERFRDENRVRKDALAAQSGSLFAGVDTPRQGFVVQRKNHQAAPDIRNRRESTADAMGSTRKSAREVGRHRGELPGESGQTSFQAGKTGVGSADRDSLRYHQLRGAKAPAPDAAIGDRYAGKRASHPGLWSDIPQPLLADASQYRGQDGRLEQSAGVLRETSSAENPTSGFKVHRAREYHPPQNPTVDVSSGRRSFIVTRARYRPISQADYSLAETAQDPETTASSYEHDGDTPRILQPHGTHVPASPERPPRNPRRTSEDHAG